MSKARRRALGRNAFVNRQLRAIEQVGKQAQRPGPHPPPDGTCIVRKVVAVVGGKVEMACGHVEVPACSKAIGDMARCLTCSWERHRQKGSVSPRYCLCAAGADLEDGAECPECGGEVG